jgi:tRNA pseudouridine55 synthase
MTPPSPPDANGQLPKSDSCAPCGVINLNKPAGMTSRRAVDIVERLSRPAKAGHAGTLDPLATGVLAVFVGGATRFIEYVQRMPKRYVGTFLLGRRSASEDIESEVIELPDAPVPGHAEIEAAARLFVGNIQQRPPVFSAIKIHGRPAYSLARRGAAVELKPRTIAVYEIQLREYKYPELTLEVFCGGGTYIRSLGRDLAESLGTAAVMSALTRVEIGPFNVADSIDPRELSAENWLDFLQPPLVAVATLPKATFSAADVARIRNGLNVEIAGRAEDELAAVDSLGQFVGILRPTGDGRWHPSRNLPTSAFHDSI